MSETPVSLARPLTGIIPPMITPLVQHDRLDHAGLERLVEHILAGGVHGLFILGTTGEGPSLSYRLRCELVDVTSQLVAKRVALLVGVTDNSFAESVKLAFDLDSLRRLFELPAIAGLKDSSSDLTYVHRVLQLIRNCPDLALLIGPEALMAEAVLMGAHGGVSGGANLAPELFVDLYRASWKRSVR